jgi:hypothetical protein
MFGAHGLPVAARKIVSEPARHFRFRSEFWLLVTNRVNRPANIRVERRAAVFGETTGLQQGKEPFRGGSENP